ncbi:MAG: hypothetical protein VYC34_09905, partial [Planctomycetota bacterium]|nr:hypothetical protein [Planctomycetota bacterium]
ILPEEHTLMSQLGMQLPGAGGVRKPQMNVYTGLIFLAFVCLAAACVVMFLAARELAPADKQSSPLAPFMLQEEGNVQVAS